MSKAISLATEHLNAALAALRSASDNPDAEIKPFVECGSGGTPPRPFLAHKDGSGNSVITRNYISWLERERNHLIKANRELMEQVSSLRAVAATEGEPEQAGCRKDDTQVCKHEFKDDGREFKCKKCGVHPSDIQTGDDEGWKANNGAYDLMPVPGHTQVDVRYRGGEEERDIKAFLLRWNHTDATSDIIAWRLHEEQL